MKQTKLDDYKRSEGLGHIKTATVETEDQPDLKEKEISEVLSNPEDFRAAIGNAQLDGIEFVEVDEKLFKYLLKNSKSKYITYGDPGIKVFKAGTRDEIEREESMSADQYCDHVGRKKMNGQS